MNSDPHGDGEVLHFGAPLHKASLAVVLLHGRGGSAEDILVLGHTIGDHTSVQLSRRLARLFDPSKGPEFHATASSSAAFRKVPVFQRNL